ncbi:MAG: hypothetical protein JXB36_17825 [Gammaproteobacteria bacterium]|nr:hypothetical protein [Gammaproteobacteria bacterium]
MEHEATVVLEKDYLHKPRNPSSERRENPPWPLRPDDAPGNGERPATEEDTHGPQAAAARISPLDKPGWFNRG